MPFKGAFKGFRLVQLYIILKKYSVKWSTLGRGTDLPIISRYGHKVTYMTHFCSTVGTPTLACTLVLKTLKRYNILVQLTAYQGSLLRTAKKL